MITLRSGNCKEVLLNLEVGAVICDPPYGLEFMGKDWDRLDGVGAGGAAFSTDGMGKNFKALPSFSGSPNPLCLNCKGSKRGNDRKGFKVCRCGNPKFPNIGAAQGSGMQAWHYEWLSVAFGSLRPGGVIKAFGGTRTFHRLAAAMEDAGFVDIHLEAWGYGSGFPKSMDVSKQLDRAAGAEREVVGSKIGLPGYSLANDKGRNVGPTGLRSSDGECLITAPSTEAAHQWDGWGTALKPAWEPVVVGRKPQ